jgi:hypothetical protein
MAAAEGLRKRRADADADAGDAADAKSRGDDALSDAQKRDDSHELVSSTSC